MKGKRCPEGPNIWESAYWLTHPYRILPEDQIMMYSKKMNSFGNFLLQNGMKPPTK